MPVMFHKPFIASHSEDKLHQAVQAGSLAGNGSLSREAAALVQQITHAGEVIMTASCSAALQMCATLLRIESGDEIIVPSFTHPASVSAFAAAGAAIRWIDIVKGTRVLDIAALPALISPRTRAVVTVHYGGVSADMIALRRFCDTNGLVLIEDAAMALDASWQTKPLGSWGDLAVFSFHQTKNIQCGEGGALCVNNHRFLEHAHLLQHCGTNKAAFLQGEVPAYTWQVFSSNYLMSALQAAFLIPQLQQCPTVTSHLRNLWQHYSRRLSSVLSPEQLPLVPPQSQHNGHCFTILCASYQQRQACIAFLHEYGIQAVFHYQPLHRAPVWQGAFDAVELPVTEEVAATILRLPMHFYLTVQDVDAVCDALATFFTG